MAKGCASTEIISRSRHHNVYLCKDAKGNATFVKRALGEHGQRMNHMELLNQRLLCGQAAQRNAGFTFLQPRMVDTKIIYPALTGAIWLGSRECMQVFAELEEYLPMVLRFLTFCHQIPLDDLLSSMEFRVSPRDRDRRFETNLKSLREAKLLSEIEQDILLRAYHSGKDARAYQHQNIMPWHIGVHPPSGDSQKVYLVDASQGGVHLYWYDAAHVLLTTAVSCGKCCQADNMHRELRRRFGSEPRFDILLRAAIAFVLAEIVEEQLKFPNRTESMLGISYAMERFF